MTTTFKSFNQNNMKFWILSLSKDPKFRDVINRRHLTKVSSVVNDADLENELRDGRIERDEL